MVSGLVMASVLLACGILTQSQIRIWKNSETLWTHVLEVSPECGLADAHLADLRIAEGNFQQGLIHVERALRKRRPDEKGLLLANAYCNWGRCLIALQRPAEAEQKFLEALKIDQEHDIALDELTNLLRQSGRPADAAQVSAHHAKALTRQLEQNPDSESAHLNLGLILARQGNVEQALPHFERAARLSPESAAAYNNLGQAQAQLNRPKEAKSNLARAITLDPKQANAHSTLAEMLEAEKDFSGAKKHFAEAVRLNPYDLGSRQRLEKLSRP